MEVNRFLHLAVDRFVLFGRGDREPPSLARNPDTKVPILVLTKGVVCDVVNMDAFRAIEVVEYYVK